MTSEHSEDGALQPSGPDAFTAQDNVSQLTHIIGGVCGALLGISMRK